MKKILSILCVIFFSLNIAMAKEDEPGYKPPKHKIDWNSSEHQLHLVGAYAINLTTYSLLKNYTSLNKPTSLFISTTATMLLSVTKELISKDPSKANMQAGLIGATGGLFIPIVFEF